MNNRRARLIREHHCPCQSLPEGSGMTDDEMHFLAKILKDGKKDPILAKLDRLWTRMWKSWDEVGKSQENLEKRGVGATEVDTLFNSRLRPDIEAFEQHLSQVMQHLKTTAAK